LRKKHALMDDANPTALMIANEALTASLLFLNLLDMQERPRMAILKTRFIAATPVNTMQGCTVIFVGFGTESKG